MLSLQRLLLITILTSMVLGLAAHSLPVDLCTCGTPSGEDAASPITPDLCLVCQLESGVHTPALSSGLVSDLVFQVSDQPALTPLEHTVQVLHPPVK